MDAYKQHRPAAEAEETMCLECSQHSTWARRATAPRQRLFGYVVRGSRCQRPACHYVGRPRKIFFKVHCHGIDAVFIIVSLNRGRSSASLTSAKKEQQKNRYRSRLQKVPKLGTRWRGTARDESSLPLVRHCRARKLVANCMRYIDMISMS